MIMSVSAELLWIVLGLVLILAEFILPSLIVIFFGVGALSVGLMVWWGWVDDTTYQLWLFGLISGALLLGLRNRFKTWFAGGSLVADTDTPDDDYIGHYATVTEGFSEGQDFGKVSYRDAHWNAINTGSSALTVGDRVLISGRQSSTLIVTKES
jgi:membrane protein implicated in regulation of membrane protease activity